MSETKDSIHAIVLVCMIGLHLEWSELSTEIRSVDPGLNSHFLSQTLLRLDGHVAFGPISPV